MNPNANPKEKAESMQYQNQNGVRVIPISLLIYHAQVSYQQSCQF